MPVTKTAKRALRSSKRKQKINQVILKRLEIAIKEAKREKNKKTLIKAISFIDRAAKKKVIHKNKASRLKGRLAKLTSSKKKKSAKKN